MDQIGALRGTIRVFTLCDTQMFGSITPSRITWPARWAEGQNVWKWYVCGVIHLGEHWGHIISNRLYENSVRDSLFKKLTPITVP